MIDTDNCGKDQWKKIQQVWMIDRRCQQTQIERERRERENESGTFVRK